MQFNFTHVILDFGEMIMGKYQTFQDQDDMGFLWVDTGGDMAKRM